MSTRSLSSDTGSGKGFLLKRKDFLGVDELASSHPNRTYYYKKDQDFEEAIEDCSSKLQVDSDDIETLFLRGSYYFKKKDFDNAIKDFSSVLDLDPQHLECIYQRGISYSKVENPDQAIIDLSMVLEKNPEHVNALFARAACYNTLGLFAQAIEDYNYALLKDSTGGTSLSNSTSTYKATSSSSTANGTYLNNASTASMIERRFFEGGNIQGNSSAADVSDMWAMLDSPDTTATNKPLSDSIDLRRSRSKSGDNSLSTVQSPMNTALLYAQKTSGGLGNSEFDLNSPKSIRSYTTNTSIRSNRVPLQYPSSSSGKLLQEKKNGFSGVDIQASSSQTSTQNMNQNVSVDSRKTLSKRPPPPIPVTTVGSSGELSNLDSANERPSRIPFSPARSTQRKTINPTPSNIELSTQVVSESDRQFADECHAKGYQLRRQGDFTGAVHEYTKALKADPRHFKALFNRGFAYDKLKLFDQAIDDYSRSLQVEPNNAFSFYNRGISLDRKGSLQAAYKDFSKAISLQPQNADFYHNRAFCLRKMGRLTEAVDDYTQCLNYAPNHFKALFNRSFCLEKLSRLQEGLIDSNRALELQPKHPGCLLTRSAIYERLGKLEEAVEDLELALDYGAPIMTTFTTKAKLLTKLGRYKEAISDLTIALKANANDINLLYSRAMCFKSSSNFSQAIIDFNKIIALDGTQGSAYSHRGYCHRKNEDYDLALADYTEAVKLEPNSLRAHNNRAYILAKLNRFQEAIEEYSILIKLDPGNSHAYHNRGISYDKVGMVDEAVSDFSKVLELDNNSARPINTKVVQAAISSVNSQISSPDNNLSSSIDSTGLHRSGSWSLPSGKFHVPRGVLVKPAEDKNAGMIANYKAPPYDKQPLSTTGKEGSVKGSSTLNRSPQRLQQKNLISPAPSPLKSRNSSRGWNRQSNQQQTGNTQEDEMIGGVDGESVDSRENVKNKSFNSSDINKRLMDVDKLLKGFSTTGVGSKINLTNNNNNIINNNNNPTLNTEKIAIPVRVNGQRNQEDKIVRSQSTSNLSRRSQQRLINETEGRSKTPLSFSRQPQNQRGFSEQRLPLPKAISPKSVNSEARVMDASTFLSNLKPPQERKKPVS